MTIFNLKFYTRRWNSSVTLNVKKTDGGWHVSHIAINGDCDPEGTPFLYSNLRQDNVIYPEGIGRFLAFIWEQLHNNEIDEPRAQQMLNELGEWISTCETSQPKWKSWNA